MKNYTDKIKELKEEIAKLEGTQDVLSLLARCTEGHDWSLTNVVGDFGLIGIIQLKCRACETNRTLHVEAKLEIVLDGELVVLNDIIDKLPEPKPIPKVSTHDDYSPKPIPNPYAGKGEYKVDTTHLLADAQARGDL
tara:strand:- start:1525 stop:1935 length:411 start_codon:yes stop_codon:yes gene_type:complete